MDLCVPSRDDKRRRVEAVFRPLSSAEVAISNAELDAAPIELAALELVSLWLGHCDLLHCEVSSWAWHGICTSPTIWGALCDVVWEEKVYVPDTIRSMRRMKPRRAFREAIVDSKRCHITREELLMFSWWSRMKASAGEHFTDSDAWWSSAPERQRVLQFHADHTTSWSAGAAGEQKTGGTWRFVPRCCGRAQGEWGRGVFDGGSGQDEVSGSSAVAREHEPQFGSFLRGRPRLAMRETPTKVVLRHTATWGFVLDSCWAVQTSWPMPGRGTDDALEDKALPLNVQNMRAEAARYNSGRTHIDPSDPDPFNGGDEPPDGLDEGGLGGNAMVQVRLGDRVVSMPLAVLQAILSRGHGSQADEGDSDSGNRSEPDDTESLPYNAPDDEGEGREREVSDGNRRESPGAAPALNGLK